MTDTYEIFEFIDSATFLRWMQVNHAITNGVWIKVHKKSSGLASISPPEALDIALCYGWIDGQRKSFDETSYLQKYTPRRARSLWSKRNIEHVERLIAAGIMTEHGLKEIDRAKSDGRWDAAYDAPSSMVIPEIFMKEVEKRPKALERFNALNKSARFSIGWQIQTAKLENTKLSRTMAIIKKLKDDSL